jgi:hypothetical protein
MRSKPSFLNGSFALPAENKSHSVLLYAGSLGYVLAFVIWAQWLLLVAYGYILALLGVVSSDFPGGIYILYLPYHYSIALLLPLAFGFTSLGWLSIYHDIKLKSALIAGIATAVIFLLFVYSAIQLLVFLDISQYPLRLFLIFAGIIFWGSAILKARTQFKHPYMLYFAGIAFVVAGVYGFSFLLPAILYFGLEYWFLLLGWLYAFATLATAYSFLQLARNLCGQQIKHPKK